MTLAAEDRVGLTDLIHRYAMYVDRRRWNDLVLLFTDDAVLTLPEPPDRLSPVVTFHGRAGVASAMAGVRDVPVTMHGVLGLVVESTGEPDVARGTVAGIAHHVSAHGDAYRDVVWHLHYVDEYRRVAGAWLFARRDVQIDWIEVRPVRRSRADERDETKGEAP